MADRVDPLKLTSLLLQYPDDQLREAAAAAGEVEIGPGRDRSQRLRTFCVWYASRPAGELQRLYVDAFDFTKQCSLHLTYHVHGDRRQRGVAMVQLKEAYRETGFEPPGNELPDYLPLMLEFAALAPDGVGLDLLEKNRVSIELIRAGLKHEDSPFAPLLDVVVAGLGRLSSRNLSRIRRLAAEGPPSEEVGLEPFAPPEVMPTDGPEPARPMVGGWEAT
jgi:nitrate reductase delta subunit